MMYITILLIYPMQGWGEKATQRSGSEEVPDNYEQGKKPLRKMQTKAQMREWRPETASA